ncbi:alkaline serine exoprotease A-like [Saccoglossus kowalevskii]|uniref:Cuticle-degrading protease-like n=1 Tax=Saccoglossus kowalevskii TaxID=10224 RepID=A0ABM0M7G4_SACKO|nr:PREDICTED: cuticle-degrading protease-like [Saccoglossus kowalevskii]
MRLVILITLATVATAYGFVEDQTVTWNLDRIDQAKAAWPNWNSQNANYDPISTGAGSVVYILSTGIQGSHNNFGPGTIRQNIIYDFDSNNMPQGADTHGRGTALAGVVGGSYTGVAIDIEIAIVRIAADPTSANITHVLQGMQAILDDYKFRKQYNPTNYLRGVALGSVSLDVRTNPADADDIENLMLQLVAEDLVVIGGVGDDDKVDCLDLTPARLYTDNSIIIAGGTNMLDYKDNASNVGECAEVWGPMEEILSSAIYPNDTDRVDYYTFADHTLAFGLAHVAGVAAIIRGRCPDTPNYLVGPMVIEYALENGGTALMPDTDGELGPIIRVASKGEHPICFTP